MGDNVSIKKKTEDNTTDFKKSAGVQGEPLKMQCPLQKNANY